MTARPTGHIASGGVESDVRFTAADVRSSDLIDSAYREKYAGFPAYVAPMLADQARATTLQLRGWRTPAWMIAARALQGVGAAALAPSTLALLSTSFPAGGSGRGRWLPTAGWPGSARLSD